MAVLEDIFNFDPDIYLADASNNSMDTTAAPGPSSNEPLIIYTVNEQGQIAAAPTTNNSNVVYNSMFENIQTLPAQMDCPNAFEFEKKVDILIQKVDQMNEKFAKFDVLAAKVDKLTEFMINIEKLISDSKSGRPQDEQTDEDFSEFDGMKPAESGTELESLETLLADTEYADKLFRFIKKNKSLDGKGNGKTISRYTIRLLMKPDACFKYTWKGQQRKGQQNPNLCFKTTFPKFIDFVNRIACAGDIKFAMDKTQSVIETFLRNKHSEASKNVQENAQQIENDPNLLNKHVEANMNVPQNAQQIGNVP